MNALNIEKDFEMENLKCMVSDLVALIPKGSKVILVDYPLYNNIGDLLIMKGTLKFFEEYNIEIIKHWSVYNFNFVPIDSNVIIVCQGGGNFGDLYPEHQILREEMVVNYPNNKIVILSQSAFYEKKESLKSTKSIFSKHKDLHIIARDKVTEKLFRNAFNENNVYLGPDMAHFLYPIITNKPSKRNLNFIRRDIENNSHYNHFFPIGCDVKDWSNITNKFDGVFMLFMQYLSVLDKKIGNRLPIFKVWNKYSDRLVNKCIKTFSNYEVVTSSRLHGHILTCLISRDSKVVDNSYGKNSTYYEAWTKNVSNTELLK